MSIRAFLAFSTIVSVCLLMAGCGEGGRAGNTDEKPIAPSGTLSLTSPAIHSGSPVSAEYTADGKDISPPLKWSGPPAGTKSYALIVDDPDAPSAEPWVHWVVYGIGPDRTELAEGASAAKLGKAPPGAIEGENSWGVAGYRGPSPPRGKPHRYFFKLFALDADLDLQPGLDKQGLLKAIQGHILAEAQLMGTYERR